VVVKDGVELTEEEVKEYYKQNIAYYKIPRYVWFMNDFPMTASGKIQKVVLRERAVEKYALQIDNAIETA